MFSVAVWSLNEIYFSETVDVSTAAITKGSNFLA